MCGILGLTHPGSLDPAVFDRMLDSMESRGPDARGVHHTPQLWLGHRRLAVLDLSAAGAQPMHSADGLRSIVFNGEVYNHRELRARFLPDHPFRSSSDTETLLALYELLGPRFVEHCVGMFAMAIHDAVAGELFLARDRFGEKPLYYSLHGGRLQFASNLTALLHSPFVERAVSREGLHGFLLNNYVPEPHTILENVWRLEPGTSLRYQIATREATLHRYWRLDPTVRFSGSDEKATDELERLLREAVGGQMLSDVPLGCFLSGGVDSSMVAAMASTSARGVGRKLQTFSVRFAEKEFDESSHARAVAAHLECDHHEVTLRPEDCLAELDALPRITGEPFADASVLPTLLLSRFTRRSVTVALSGDAGDELFLGYDRYRWAMEARRRTGWLPCWARSLGCQLGAALPNYRARMFAGGLDYEGEHDLYSAIFMGWNRRPATELMKEPMVAFDGPMQRLVRRHRRTPLPAKMGLIDLEHYLPGDILTKVDRAGMASSLESRIPFLDHRLVEFAVSLPSRMRMGPRGQKLILRRVLERYVPKSLTERPKAGFAVPLRTWFRGPLRGMLDDALSPKALGRHGLLRSETVQLLRKRHASGRWNHERQLFALLAFQRWAGEFL
jgi:asparagine synthase (glutamine-hydrolysing)